MYCTLLWAHASMMCTSVNVSLRINVTALRAITRHLFRNSITLMRLPVLPCEPVFPALRLRSHALMYYYVWREARASP